MPFGQQANQRSFRGLDLRRQEAGSGDEFARVFKNMVVESPGNFAKRRGHVRAIERLFPGPVMGIIPTQYCFFLKRLLIHIDDRDRTSTGRTGQFIGIPPVVSCRTVPNVTGFVAMAEQDPLRVELTWTNPGFQWLAGIRIVRSRDGQPTGPNDPNADLIIDLGIVQQFTDLNVEAQVRFFYAAFAFTFC